MFHKERRPSNNSYIHARRQIAQHHQQQQRSLNLVAAAALSMMRFNQTKARGARDYVPRVPRVACARLLS